MRRRSFARSAPGPRWATLRRPCAPACSPRSCVCAAFTALAAAPAGAGPANEGGHNRAPPCPDGTRWMCGKIRRPPRSRASRRPPHRDRLPLAARPARARRQAAAGRGRGRARVPVDRQPRASTAAIFGPLLRNRDLLLVDNRGTGTSALIDCPRAPALHRRELGTRLPRRRGRLRASDRAPLSARRPARGRPLRHRLRGATTSRPSCARLRLRHIDLYGDSYGTWFVQSFISRHRERLNSVLLDSAYPVRGLDPWYASSGRGGRARALRRGVRARRRLRRGGAGERDGAPRAAGGAAAAAPITGADARRRRRRVRGARGRARAWSTWSRTPASDPVIYRELDASVRAALAGDDVPLLRLAAQSQTGPRREPGRLLLGRPLLRRQLHRLPAALLHARPRRRSAAPSSPPRAARRRRARSRRSPPRVAHDERLLASPTRPASTGRAPRTPRRLLAPRPTPAARLGAAARARRRPRLAHARSPTRRCSCPALGASTPGRSRCPTPCT